MVDKGTYKIMKYTILVTNIMDKKYFVGNIYVCNTQTQYSNLYVGLLTLFEDLGYVVNHEQIRDDEDTIARLRIERKPIPNGNNDTNN